MTHLVRLLAALLVSAAAVFPAAPAQAGPLNPDKVEAFLASYEQLKSLTGQSGLEAPSNPWRIRHWADLAARNGSLAAVLARHGFSVESWLDTGRRVVAAYTALEMHEAQKELDAQNRERIDSINNDPSLSREQKEDMLAAMRSADEEAAGYLDVPASELAAVKPFVARLEKAFGP